MDEENRILVRAIIEMLGSPKDHIEETIKDYVEKLKEDLDVKSAEIEPAKEQEKFFSTFVELEIYFDKLSDVIAFCFDSMPSSIEIIEPEEIKLQNNDLSNALNDLQAKNHELDMHVKNLKSTNQLLDQNGMNIFRNFVRYIAKDEAKTKEEISTIVGIPEGAIKIFLDRLVEANAVSLSDGKYKFENE